MLAFLRPVWAFRGFILGTVKREFQSKYRNSLFGATWMIVSPLAQILVYTVIFSKIMDARLPGIEGTFGYSIHLCAGILTWGLFSEISSRSVSMFLDNANLLKKLSFPRLCLPIALVVSSLLNFTIVFGLFTCFLLATGNFPGIAYIALVPLLVVLVMFAVGMGMVLGVLNVFFRDVGQLFGIVIMFWFWLTPIIYPLSILPERIQPLMALNPMAALIGQFQTVLVRGGWPEWEALTYPVTLAIVLCLLGLRLFRRHAGEMVDEL